MIDVVLKSFLVNEISVINKKSGAEKIALENKYSYNMKIVSPTVCTGEFKITIQEKNAPNEFSITATCISVFEYPQKKDNTDIHMESMRAMFPYVRSFISTLTSNMGISTINIPPIDFGNISIVNVKFPQA